MGCIDLQRRAIPNGTKTGQDRARSISLQAFQDRAENLLAGNGGDVSAEQLLNVTIDFFHPLVLVLEGCLEVADLCLQVPRSS